MKKTRDIFSQGIKYQKWVDCLFTLLNVVVVVVVGRRRVLQVVVRV